MQNIKFIIPFLIIFFSSFNIIIGQNNLTPTIEVIDINNIKYFSAIEYSKLINRMETSAMSNE